MSLINQDGFLNLHDLVGKTRQENIDRRTSGRWTMAIARPHLIYK